MRRARMHSSILAADWKLSENASLLSHRKIADENYILVDGFYS